LTAKPSSDTKPQEDAAVSLPILTFDERVLSPRFGYVFRRRWLQPYESIVGMLWEFARMNGLPGHAVARHLCGRAIDPYEGIDPLELDVPLVAQLLGLTRRCVRAAIGTARANASASPDLRYCPKCLNLGYHGRLHQLLHHQRCPIHGLPLRTHCRHCDQTSAYRLDAQLLDAPFRCRHCRFYYTRSGASPPATLWALTGPDRVAITRAALA
jgi:hypothetical protein